MAFEQQELGELSTLQILKATLDLFQDPSKWSKGWFALDAYGEKVASCDPTAHSYCIIGGLRKIVAGPEHIKLKCVDELCKTLSLVGRYAISDWNDNYMRTHADVINALQKTIERLES